VLKAIKQVWEEEDINKGIINIINKKRGIRQLIINITIKKKY